MKRKNIIKIFITFLIIITFCFLNGCEFVYYIFDFLFESVIDLSGKLAVHFIDVGQGDSILIQNPDNEFILIDTGEKDQYEKLSSYLEHYKVKKFKYVIFTHPHSDHIGSADKIVKNYDIENIIMPEYYHTTKTFERLMIEIENKNLEITPAVPGETFKFGEADFMVLAPISENYKSLNNNSVVIKMTYGKNNFLFTGDMEKESENEVIAYCDNNNINLSVDILKVAHHGSSTSSQTNFLKQINPSFAVIMCGINNNYNHPNLKVVDRIEKNGAEVLRTDLEGDIIITSDGKTVEIAQKGRGTNGNYSSGNSEDNEKEENEDFIEED